VLQRTLAVAGKRECAAAAALYDEVAREVDAIAYAEQRRLFQE
jgi:hypothetical protein